MVIGRQLLFLQQRVFIKGTVTLLPGLWNRLQRVLLAIMLIGGLLGTHFGKAVKKKLSDTKIKSYFVYVVLFAIAMVAFKLFRITFG